MLSEHAPVLPEGGEWEYDYSWAGERVLAMKQGAGVRLVSVFHRRDLTNRFPVVAAMVAKVAADAVVIDGIIRAIEPRQAGALGLPSSERPAASPLPTIRLIGFDLLWLGNADLRRLPLVERRQRLGDVIRPTGILEPLRPAVPVAGMLAEARRIGAEGVLARRKDSCYRPFARTGDWVRVSGRGEGPGSPGQPASPAVEGTPAFGFDASGACGVNQLA